MKRVVAILLLAIVHALSSSAQRREPVWTAIPLTPGGPKGVSSIWITDQKQTIKLHSHRDSYLYRICLYKESYPVILSPDNFHPLNLVYNENCMDVDLPQAEVGYSCPISPLDCGRLGVLYTKVQYKGQVRNDSAYWSAGWYSLVSKLPADQRGYWRLESTKSSYYNPNQVTLVQVSRARLYEVCSNGHPVEAIVDNEPLEEFTGCREFSGKRIELRGKSPFNAVGSYRLLE